MKCVFSFIISFVILAGIFSGCSVDVNDGNSKPVETETEAEKSNALTPNELLEAERDRIEASFSKTNDVPLYIKKPMAWFEETNKQMIFARQKLLEVQARISMIYGKYDRQIKEAGDKASGYLDLLDKAEKAREKGKSEGWPVAFEQWVIDDEDALNAKIAEINATMGKNRVLSVEDTAMYNAAKKGLENVRGMLVQFDDDYRAFTRVWDMVKLGQLDGIPIELDKEIKSALDITQIYVNEWNRVK